MYKVKTVERQDEKVVLSEVKFGEINSAEKYFNLLKTSMINNPEEYADKKLVLVDPEENVISYFVIG